MLLALTSLLIMQNATPDLSQGGISTERPIAIHSSPANGQWNPKDQSVDDNFLTSFITEQTDPAGKRVDHFFSLEYKSPRKIHGFVYIPDPYRMAGRIKDYTFCVSNDSNYTHATYTSKGTFPRYNASFWPDEQERFHTIWFPKPIEGSTFTLVSHNDHIGSNQTAIGELVPIFDVDHYRYKNTTLAHLKGLRMAPSVHLGYNNHKNEFSQEADLYYLEMTPTHSDKGTYFMSIGFDGGYFGMQEQSNGNKVIIFSVWDSAGTDNKHEVALDQRVRAIYVDTNLVIRRFGGEGVGVQTFLDFDWNINETYKFALRFDPCANDNFGVFTAFFFDPKLDMWRQLASLALPGRQRKLTGFHSFVEDFRRNFYSFDKNRTAEFSNIWMLRSSDKKWIPANQARFTIDSNPQRNVDAGAKGSNRAFLSTGGNISEKTTKVYQQFKFNQVDSELTLPVMAPRMTAPLEFKVLKFKEIE